MGKLVFFPLTLGLNYSWKILSLKLLTIWRQRYESMRISLRWLKRLDLNRGYNKINTEPTPASRGGVDFRSCDLPKPNRSLLKDANSCHRSGTMRFHIQMLSTQPKGIMINRMEKSTKDSRYQGDNSPNKGREELCRNSPSFF